MGKPSLHLAGNLANPSAFPVTAEQIAWARRRPPGERTAMPREGQRVGYRHWPLGEVIEARIISVNLDSRDDFNVWRFVLDGQGRPVEVGGQRVMERVDDPWPSVLLDTRSEDGTETNFGMIETREARIEGSPGWLPWRPDFATSGRR